MKGDDPDLSPRLIVNNFKYYRARVEHSRESPFWKSYSEDGRLGPDISAAGLLQSPIRPLPFPISGGLNRSSSDRRLFLDIYVASPIGILVEKLVQ